MRIQRRPNAEHRMTIEQRYVERWNNGRLVGRGTQDHRTGDDRCPGCCVKEGPCDGPLCGRCSCCEWSCTCDGDFCAPSAA